jgi:hypothetical protein
MTRNLRKTNALQVGERVIDVKKDCTHKNKKDLRQGLTPPHYYCPDCKGHWYGGRFWTRAEWDEWVNDEMGI